MVGVALGVGLFSGVLFFVDGSAATMTSRALAPLDLDMQRIVTAEPSGMTLTERITGATALDAGQQTTIELTVTNDSAAPSNEVVVRDEPVPPLTYVGGTTTVDGIPVPDVEGDSPLSHGVAGFGFNIGRVEPGESVTISYAAEATDVVADVGALGTQATVSSRELPVPIVANAERILTLDELLAQVAAIPGVAAADGLGMVDLPPGALAADGTEVSDPVRLFAFDQAYLDHYPSIEVVAGELDPGGALLSVEAARSLGIEPGGEISLQIPGRDEPIRLSVGGVVDLARAEPLFSSRKASKLEEFLYVPNSVVISPELFRDEIIPAFGRERATVGIVTRSFPTLEADVLVDRARLRAEPATALTQTTTVAAAIDRIGPGQGYLIDNISNTLTVASEDAAAGRRMFLFLGLPGALLAAFLAAYAGSVLAATERREHATLRVRGAHLGHLRTIALTKALVIACIGSAVGVVLGAASAAAVLGWGSLSEASATALATSAVLAVGVGLAITAIALYLPARRSVRREVSEERRSMRAPTVPAWRRLGLDVALAHGGRPHRDRRDPARRPRSAGRVRVRRGRRLAAGRSPARAPGRLGRRPPPVRAHDAGDRRARARAVEPPLRRDRSGHREQGPPATVGRPGERDHRARPRGGVRGRVGAVRRDVRRDEGRRRPIHGRCRPPDHSERPRRATRRELCHGAHRSRRVRGVTRGRRPRERGPDRAVQPAAEEPRGRRSDEFHIGRAAARSGVHRCLRRRHAGRPRIGSARCIGRRGNRGRPVGGRGRSRRHRPRARDEAGDAGALPRRGPLRPVPGHPVGREPRREPGSLPRGHGDRHRRRLPRGCGRPQPRGARGGRGRRCGPVRALGIPSTSRPPRPPSTTTSRASRRST